MTQFKVKLTLQQASKLDSLENVQRLHQDAKLSNMNEKESRCRYSLLELYYLKPNMTWREKTRIMIKHLVLWPFQQYVDNLEEIIDIFGFGQSIHLKLWPNPPPHTSIINCRRKVGQLNSLATSFLNICCSIPIMI